MIARWIGAAPRQRGSTALKLFLLESVDEFDGGEEPDALAMVLDGLDADRRSEMRLACAGAADEDDIVGVLQKLATMQLTCEGLVDLTAGEVKARKIAIVRKAGGFVDLTSLSAVSAFRSCDKIGSAVSKAGGPCSVSSPTAWAMPCRLQLTDNRCEGVPHAKQDGTIALQDRCSQCVGSIRSLGGDSADLRQMAAQGVEELPGLRH
jgi:hypothetical protein